MSTIVTNPANNEKIDANRIIDNVIVANERPGKNGKLYGSIMLEQEILSIAGGFANNQRRVAFINGEISTLKQVVAKFGLTPGSEILDHRIAIVESFNPLYPGQEPKINPDSKQVMTRDGKPIYRNYLLTHVNSDVVDSLIAHDVASTLEGNMPSFSKDEEIMASLKNQMQNSK